MQPQNLSQYYSSQNKVLPKTAAERFADPAFKAAAEAAGYNASTYAVNAGNADANTKILQNLLKGVSTATTPKDQATDLANSQQTTNTKNIVSSSDNVVQDERNTTSLIKGLNIPDPNIETTKKASEDYMKLIDDQLTKLEERRKAEIEGINASFDATKVKTEDAQNREKGTTNVALMRAGGYLGTQISGVGVLNNLAQTHRQEITALEAKRAAAIREANNAIDDKSFELARKKAEEVKNLDKEINDRRNKFFDQSIKLSEEIRQTESSTLKNAIDRSERIAPTLLESIAGMDETQSLNYIISAAKDLRIDPNLLMGEVNKLSAERAEKEAAQVVSLATKYPSAGISRSDSFDVAQQKVRGSKEYKLDIAKAEADLTNTRSLINTRAANESIDYGNPILSLYANSTGKLVGGPSEARAVMGYAENVLGEKEIVSDKFEGPLSDNQIKEADAKKLLGDAFLQFAKTKDVELPDSTVWSWLSSEEARGMSDEEKKQEIMSNGKNPEDFGIY